MIEISINTKSPYKTIKYINKLKINIYQAKYLNNKIELKINKKDLDKLSKFYQYQIIKVYGIEESINYIKKNILSIIYLIIIIIGIIFITRITINIEVMN